MQKKNTTLNFTGQTFFIGLDVHKKSWNVAIRSNGLLLKIFSMNPDADELWKYLTKNYPMVHWSGRFIEHLKTLEFIYPLGKDQLDIYIVELLELRSRLLLILKTIRKYIREYKRQDELELLLSIPGFGYTTAITFLTELIDIDRFSRFDQLAGFVGLVPSTRSSGEKDKTIGLSNRFNKYLRTILIE